MNLMKLSVLVVFCSLSFTVSAQVKNNLEAKTPNEIIASVGKTTITQQKFEEVLKSEIKKGKKDSPQLRAEVRNSLINKEVLLQEIKKQGLDKKTIHVDAIKVLQETYLIEALFKENLVSNPIAEQEIRATYDSEYASKSSNLLEYKLKELVFNSEKDALGVLQRLKKGESFDKIWLEQATGNKKNLDQWISHVNLVPVVSNVIVYINKGSYSLNPINLGTRWILIKVDDTRPYKIPEYEKVKGDIYSNLVQRRNQQFMQKLRNSTNITNLSQ
jgi:peptidyl-prolyl cis-trans isomerase C